MSVEEFLNQVKTAYNTNFPNGWIRGKVESRFGQTSLWFRFGVQPESKHSHGIEQNDPSLHVMLVEGINKEPLEFHDGIAVQLAQGGSVLVDPEPGSRGKAFDSVKAGWKNKAGTPEQVLKHITNYLAKLRKTVDDNKNRMQNMETAATHPSLKKGDHVEIANNSIFEMMGHNKVSGTVVIVNPNGKSFSFKCDQTHAMEICDFGDGDLKVTSTANTVAELLTALGIASTTTTQEAIATLEYVLGSEKYVHKDPSTIIGPGSLLARAKLLYNILVQKFGGKTKVTDYFGGKFVPMELKDKVKNDPMSVFNDFVANLKELDQRDLSDSPGVVNALKELKQRAKKFKLITDDYQAGEAVKEQPAAAAAITADSLAKKQTDLLEEAHKLSKQLDENATRYEELLNANDLEEILTTEGSDLVADIRKWLKQASQVY